MIDVHDPHEPIHGVRDFFIHLFTITIGLLIALGLEGCVEWQHHRHLVHQAQASLHAEIEHNAQNIAGALTDLHEQQAGIRKDIATLDYILKNHKAPDKSHLTINFRISTLSDVSWKTAQMTTAISYMSYPQAEQYSNIYATQSDLQAAETQAARDALVSVGPLMDANYNDPDPTGGRAGMIKERLEIFQGQLLLVDSFLNSLDGEYKKFLSTNPE